MLIYVVDIIVSEFNQGVFTYLIHHLGNKFSLNDLGNLYYFLEIEVIAKADGFFLNQTDML